MHINTTDVRKKMKTFSVYIFLILVVASPLYAGQKNDLARLNGSVKNAKVIEN